MIDMDWVVSVSLNISSLKCVWTPPAWYTSKKMNWKYLSICHYFTLPWQPNLKERRIINRPYFQCVFHMTSSANATALSLCGSNSIFSPIIPMQFLLQFLLVLQAIAARSCWKINYGTRMSKTVPVSTSIYWFILQAFIDLKSGFFRDNTLLVSRLNFCFLFFNSRRARPAQHNWFERVCPWRGSDQEDHLH